MATAENSGGKKGVTVRRPDSNKGNREDKTQVYGKKIKLTPRAQDTHLALSRM